MQKIGKYSIFHKSFINKFMSQDKLIKLVNKATGTTYMTRKNKKLVTRKIELKKFDKKLRKHVIMKESKK